MAVIKANVQDNFVVITNSVAQDPDISISAKGLILIMASRPPGWKFNKAQLMDNAGVGRDKLNGLFRELINKGFLAVSQNHDEKGHFTNNDYYFFSDPRQNPAYIEQVNTEKSTVDGFAVDGLAVNGKTAPINKESLKKKENKQNGQNEIIDRAFNYFWENYPKKAAKQKALSAFKSLVRGKSENSIIELTDRATNYITEALSELKQGNTRFLGYDNMNASTYLNQKRWEDEQ